MSSFGLLSFPMLEITTFSYIFQFLCNMLIVDFAVVYSSGIAFKRTILTETWLLVYSRDQTEGMELKSIIFINSPSYKRYISNTGSKRFKM